MTEILAEHAAVFVRANIGVAIGMAMGVNGTHCSTEGPSQDMPMSIDAFSSGSESSHEYLPLTVAQRGLWFSHHLNPDAKPCVYKVAECIHLDGAIQPDTFTQAIHDTVADTDVLRLIMVETAEGPAQYFADTVPDTFRHIDVSNHSAPEQAANEWMQADINGPFPLANGPLSSQALIKLDENKWLFYHCYHHMVMDGLSTSLFLRRLAERYSDLVAGRISCASGFSRIQEVLVAEQEYAASSRAQQDRTYWVDLLKDRPVPASLAGGQQATCLDVVRRQCYVAEETVLGLRGLAEQEGKTLPQLLSTLVVGYIYGMTRQDDLLLGMPVMARSGKVLRQFPGMASNGVPLRLTLNAEESFANNLACVSQGMYGVMRHQRYRTEAIKAALNMRGERDPLYSTLINIHPFQYDDIRFGDVPVRVTNLALGPVDDLLITLMDRGESGGLEICLSANAAVHNGVALDWHLHRIRHLLDRAPHLWHEPLSRCDFRLAEERDAVLGWGAASAVLNANDCLHILFERQVAKRPDATAVRCDGKSLTYGELNARANRLAHLLIAKGTRPDARVAIALERELTLPMAILATLKAGGAYVPLDPHYPQERLQYILNDSAPEVLITTRALLPMLGPLGDALAVIVLDDIDETQLSSDNPDPNALGLTAAHMAYIIYTSGSTGQPKGVMVEHRNVVRLLASTEASFDFGPDDVWTLFHSYAFDFSVWEFWGALAYGGRLVVVPALTARAPDAFYALLCQERVTVLNQTPSAFRQLVAALPEGTPQHMLRWIVFGGEALDVTLLAPWYAQNGDRTRLVNMYGITETTVHVTFHALTQEDVHRKGNSPIGQPLNDLSLYVLDAAGEPVPVGVTGELYVGGAGVTRGYLNRPELTAERFLPDPFAATSGARMYRTGDVGRWNADGTLDYLGRNDRQVKVRGFRIELGEIGARLAEHVAVKEAVVVAHAEGKDTTLVAYVVAQDGATLEAAELRRHLSGSLPDYMVPSAFVTLDTLPLTANGKLDERALPVPEANARAVTAYEAPQGVIEETLATLWQQLLGVEQVGRHDDFFALGGHSLLAVQLASRVRTTLNITLPLSMLFDAPVLQALAAALAHEVSEPALPAIDVTESDRGPLSLTQQRLWLLSRMSEEAAAAYVMSGNLALHGTLNEEALQQALDALMARHDSLRTVIANKDGQPEQRVTPCTQGFPLTRLESGTVPAFSPHFDLETGPLVQGRLVQQAPHRHVLQIAFHHVIADGWSIGVFLDELCACYDAWVTGTPVSLPPLPVRFIDYAAWQRRYLTGDVLHGQVHYWAKQLAQAPDCLTLPTDRPRPEVQSFEGGHVHFSLDSALVARLESLGQQHGCTLFMTLLASWSVLMSRLSGQQDIVTGTPVAGRAQQVLEPLIGMFVNTLALRVRLDEAPDTAALLAQVRATMLAAQQHADLPFEQVVEAVSPVRHTAHSPLFQTLLALHNTPETRMTLPGLDVTLTPSPQTAAHVDLTVELAPKDGKLNVDLHFAAALFDRQTVLRWVNYWQRLLTGMVVDPSRSVMALPMLSEEESRQLLADHTPSDMARQAPSLLHALVEAQAIKHPKAVAVATEQEQQTFDELNAAANRLAHWLIAQGVVPDSRVAVAIERGPELVVALLAVLKAGGAYVPFDPAYPQARLAYMLDDCAPQAIITSREVRPRLPLLRETLPIVLIDAPHAPWAEAPEYNPDAQALGLTPNHLAYVIYTSGSTGQPKGVMIEHRHVVNLVHWHTATFGLSAGQRTSCVAGLGFDAAVWEIWPPLAAGAQLSMPAPDEARDPERLLAWWQSQPLDVGFLPTPVAELAFARGMTHPTLRVLLVGGDRLSRRPPAGARFTLINNYGPTENTVVATSGEVQGDDTVLHIGRPIANTRVYLLDAYGAPVPVGVAGELYVGGAQVARGYLNRPDLTAELFVPDPFAEENSARMYRTGDLARWRTDGTLEFLGRNDFQVKIRGFRIEPGEVASALLACEGVEEAIVVADKQGDIARLIAYVTLSKGLMPLTPEQLRQALVDRLPGYMVPAAYVVLDALPLTANGKVDRRALPAPCDADFLHHAYEAPQGPVEEVLAEQWQTLLGVEHVGRHDDFFALGGHSLLAVQLISRIREVLGHDLPLATLFAHPVLSTLAERLPHTAQVSLPPIVPMMAGQVAPLSLAQQRLWFLAQMDKAASAAYVISGGLCLEGPLNVVALRRALDRIVARQAALRTRIDPQAEGAVQVVAPADVGFPLEIIDRVDATDLAPFMPTFDLTVGPLACGQLVRFADDRHWLRLALHHVIADGWSVSLLVKELSTLYAAFVQGDSDPLPPLTVQYGDHAAWQQLHLSGELLQRQQYYWVDHLSGAPECLTLPTDRPRPARQCYDGGHVRIELDAALLTRVDQLSRRHGCTRFMTLLASWSVLMNRLSGQADIVIGTPVAARHRREIEPVIGMFVNTQALRIDLSDAPDTDTLLAQVRETALAAQQHADVPFEQVVEAVSPRRSLSHSPLFQVMLALHNLPEATPSLVGVRTSPLANDIATSQFDLNLELQEQEGRLVGTLYYATALFDRETVTQWSKYWVRVLEGMVATPQRPVTVLPLDNNTAAKRGIVSEAAAPVTETLHRLFEAQATSMPEAVAVLDDDGALTYGALEADANRVAQALRARGVTLGARVGLCVQRGRAMVVGMLGILKAGAAYVPLDHHHPAERLVMMINDAGAALILTDAVGREALGRQVKASVLPLVGPEAFQRAASTDPLLLNIAPDQLAYVIYTSGSTGRPKGIAMPHAPLVNLIRWQNRTPVAVTSQFAAFGFDVASQEILSALLGGGTLAIVPEAARLDMPQLIAFFDDRKVSRAFLPPALLSALARTAQALHWQPSLQEVICSGEALRIDDDIRALFARTPTMHLVNQYGPAETHVVCAARNAIDATAWPELPPIGEPIPGAVCYVLDDAGQPVPPGVTGELYIGGKVLSRGYLGLPEQQAERFLPDPFSAEPGARLYRTGDLVRQQRDSMLDYVGRNDHQITLRGFRIEPGDIEHCLRCHPEVSDALVMMRENEGGAHLTAYVQGAPDMASLVAHARAALPDYMVPAAWAVMDAFPLTRNGKVDRRALPAPESTVLNGECEAPMYEEEEAMAALWQRLLGVEQVGRHDDFFALGGHSLLAVRLMAEIAREQDVTVPVAALFEHPTLAAFSEQVMDLGIAQFDLDALLDIVDDETGEVERAEGADDESF